METYMGGLVVNTNLWRFNSHICPMCGVCIFSLCFRGYLQALWVYLPVKRHELGADCHLCMFVCLCPVMSRGTIWVFSVLEIGRMNNFSNAFWSERWILELNPFAMSWEHTLDQISEHHKAPCTHTVKTSGNLM